MPDLIHRPRRLRKTENLRALVRETRLAPEDFILPLFACAGEGVRREIKSMPGVHNLSVDEIVEEAAAPRQAASVKNALEKKNAAAVSVGRLGGNKGRENKSR